jgi:endoglucanase
MSPVSVGLVRAGVVMFAVGQMFSCSQGEENREEVVSRAEAALALDDAAVEPPPAPDAALEPRPAPDAGPRPPAADAAVGRPSAETVVNGSFDLGMPPWWSYGMVTEDVASGAYCAISPASVNIWEAGVGQTLAVTAGVSYQLSFVAQGDPQPIHATVQNPVTFFEYVGVDLTPTGAGDRYVALFTAPETVSAANLVFQVASAGGPRAFCIDDVSLLGGRSVPIYTPDTGPRVRVNQVGYLPFGPKHATLVTGATAPLTWELHDAGGHLVANGQTLPLGRDDSSALATHDLDFSSFRGRGEGYTLAADGDTSFPFSIARKPYEDLRVDALRVYYTQRSGEAIDGQVAGAGYARPAGHASAPGSGSVNQGDRDVPCQPADNSLAIYGEPWTCDYTLDVAGGWYDAGDHGKYVVNGGISVYQLLNAFERTKVAPTSDLGALGDGTLHIPESDNGVPDVLDEARYELEFMLKMMVPEGKPLAGMVHHKVHDSAWTGLPLLPHQDPMPRWLHRPSTAATLNLAATAAQGARIYAHYAPAFSRRLLAAATTAWQAARAHPDLFAPPTDGTGGGAYEDGDVSDEFYWAAAELYLTTGKSQYLDFALGSPLHTAEIFWPDGFYWGSVAALARLDLATIPSALPDRDRIIASVVAAAQRYLSDQAANPFGHPYLPYGGTYQWGSNSQVLNNLVVIATAYDLTQSEPFRRGVLQGFDYILGRNALNISYVTNYGRVFSHNQHSRLYSNQLNPALPHPPAGTLSGGPNSVSSSWDPVALRLFGVHGCAPQFCYVDDINSYSTNELAINWNSALTWVASFVADQDGARAPNSTNCEVEYRRIQGFHGGFGAEIHLTNTSSAQIDNWRLAWSFIGDQWVDDATGVWANQSGASVVASPAGSNRRIGPGKSVGFRVFGQSGKLANPDPVTFLLNGVACSTR